MRVLEGLYKLPIVNVNKIAEWTELSRVNANNIAAKMVKVGILVQQDKEIQYARTFEYRAYLSLFSSEGRVRGANERTTRSKRG
jgi:hypothetical protein